MPTKDFMVVDARHDHSIRIPRPDLTEKIGAPNACSKCHAESPARWATEWAVRWWGSEKSSQPHYGEAIHAGRAGLPGAGHALAAVAADPTKPGIVRGTAAALMGRNPAPDSLATLQQALKDSDPLVREGALTALEDLDPRARVPLAAPLLRDPIFSVRIQAARLLAAPGVGLTAEQQSALESGLADYRQVQEWNADRPESRLNLGSLHAEKGRVAEAEEAYRAAIRIAPGFAPAYVNLADLYRGAGRDGEGEDVLLQGLEAVPGAAALHHSLGLLLAREKRMPEALEALERAAEMEPSQARFSYVYGVALESSGRMDRALNVLKAAHEAHPGNRDILAALATFSRKNGEHSAAIAYAEKLVAVSSGDPGALQLLQQVRSEAPDNH